MLWREKTYDELPALSIRGRELRRSLRLVTVSWMWGVIWSTCVSGDQMRAFARMAGFNDFAFGILAAIPFLATLAQLPAALLVERTGFRKFIFLDSLLISRVLWLPLAAIPLVFNFGATGSPAAVVTVLTLMAVSYILAHLGTPGWTTWMGDLVPRRIRGRFFARRQQITTLVQIFSIILISLVLGHYSGPGSRGRETAATNPALLWAICAIFFVGGICGIMDILMFRKLREIFPRFRERKPRPSTFAFHLPKPRGLLGVMNYGRQAMGQFFNQALADPLRDHVFRNYIMYGSLMAFTATVGGWYFWIHSRNVLGFSPMTANVLFLVVSPLSAIASAGWWGRFIDRWGRRPVLIIGTIGTILSVVPWAVLNPQQPFLVSLDARIASLVGWAAGLLGKGGWPGPGAMQGAATIAILALGNIAGGAGWNGVNLAQNAVILGFADGAGRNRYVAASSVLINLGGALGGIVGGIVAQACEGLHPAIGAVVLNNYQITFLIGGVLRVAAIGLLVRMPDPGSRDVRDLLRVWRGNVHNLMTSSVFYPLRFFGWASRSNKDNPHRRSSGRGKPS